MSALTEGTTKVIDDSRKQALQALISSLTPDGSADKKLSDEQVNALSDRLNQFLGDGGEGPEVRRNEKGEVLNEEGLPIIDISEPVNDSSVSSQAPEAFVSEEDPPQLWSLSEQERTQLRIRRDRILDILEEEEARGSSRKYELERLRQAEEVAKMDAASKAAAREMQKKMGKALVKNLVAQRERDEEERKKALEKEETTIATRASGQNGDPIRRKSKKSVSFANVPEFDEVKPKPKPSVAWGDVSVAKLKSGVPRAELKTEVLNRQPMKMEVVERVSGHERISSSERDSDDESNPGENAEDEEYTPSLDADFDGSDESTEEGGDSEEEEYDFSQAGVQREVALEYIRLRESVGAEAARAMNSNTHEADEWEQPEVPLDASLSSKPEKRGISQFKAERRANLTVSEDSSISLGTSVLPQGKSHTVQKAVRTGKLENGKLVGGEAGDSDSDIEDRETVKRTLEMLKSGIVPDLLPDKDTDPQKMTDDSQHVLEQSPSSSVTTPSQGHPPETKPTKTSRFLAERGGQKQTSERATVASTSAASISSPLSAAIVERPTSKGSPTVPSRQSGITEHYQPSANAAFKKPPTVISVPSVPPSEQRRAFPRPLVPPDPAVLNNMIVESPSFPPLGARAPTDSGSGRAPALVSEVRESTRKAGIPEEPPARRTGRVSRFKAERS